MATIELVMEQSMSKAQIKKLTKDKSRLKYSLGRGEKKNLVVAPEVHALVVDFAEKRGTTMIEATYYYDCTIG